jgi:hypothetical protein
MKVSADGWGCGHLTAQWLSHGGVPIGGSNFAAPIVEGNEQATCGGEFGAVNVGGYEVGVGVGCVCHTRKISRPARGVNRFGVTKRAAQMF